MSWTFLSTMWRINGRVLATSHIAYPCAICHSDEGWFREIFGHYACLLNKLPTANLQAGLSSSQENAAAPDGTSGSGF